MPFQSDAEVEPRREGCLSLCVGTASCFSSRQLGAGSWLREERQDWASSVPHWPLDQHSKAQAYSLVPSWKALA